MLRSLKGTSESLTSFNLSGKIGKQQDLQTLSRYPEKYTIQNNKLGSLTFISGTKMDLLPWNFADDKLETTIIITISHIALFVRSLSVWF